MEIQQCGIDVVVFEKGMIESEWGGIAAADGLLEIAGNGVIDCVTIRTVFESH